MILNLNLTLSLPDWQPEYESWISQDAFEAIITNAKERLEQAMKVMGAWQNTGNETLFDYVQELLIKIRSDMSTIELSITDAAFNRVTRQKALLIDLSAA